METADIKTRAGEEPLPEEIAALSGPAVLRKDAAVFDAENAVLRAEQAGVTDEVAMRRLDRMRRERRELLVARQWRRAMGKRQPAVSRVGQVVPFRPQSLGEVA